MTMFFVESELPKRNNHGGSKVCQDLIKDFIESRYASVEVFNEGTFLDNNNMRHGLASAAKDSGIKVTMVNGRVFMEKEKVR